MFITAATLFASYFQTTGALVEASDVVSTTAGEAVEAEHGDKIFPQTESKTTGLEGKLVTRQLSTPGNSIENTAIQLSPYEGQDAQNDKAATDKGPSSLSDRIESVRLIVTMNLVWDELAEKFYKQFRDEKWSLDQLKTKLGIVEGMSPDSDEEHALTSILMFAMYEDIIIKATDDDLLTNGIDILTKLSKDSPAITFFGQYVGGTLTQKALKKKLGITGVTPKSSEKYQAFELLVDARVFYDNLEKIEIDPLKSSILKMTTMTKNPLVDKFYDQFMNEKWTTKKLVSKLGITKYTAADSEKYDALSSLVQGRMYVHGVTNAKTLISKNKTKTFLAKLHGNELAQKYLGQFMAGSLKETSLKAELKVTKNTPKDSDEYEAAALLIEARELSDTFM
ncbi:hypothetical protein AM587_10005580 [Phytophthora nicotianae]|uniref:RxLR effector candidate protein n=1 Tax=Phytophthora nicotianae TaxID=4792 RepID=A0A0W8CKL3_PHYNI|nr:hypothetical protein AM587_10005580 [Phytophthora nicotianae]